MSTSRATRDRDPDDAWWWDRRPGPGQLSLVDGLRVCGWCEGPIRAGSRSDAKFCRQSCRQASHRFGRGLSLSPASGRPLRMAYADPPYPGKAHLYRDQPDYAGEVDHAELVDRLVSEFPDGWALSTSSTGLQQVLSIAPRQVRVGVWVRGERPVRSWRPLSAWEAVVFMGGRARLSSPAARRVDVLVHHHQARRSDPRRVLGAKPAAFIAWLFDLLGLAQGDELVDLFPGSGGVARALRYASAGQARHKTPGGRDG